MLIANSLVMAAPVLAGKLVNFRDLSALCCRGSLRKGLNRPRPDRPPPSDQIETQAIEELKGSVSVSRAARLALFSAFRSPRPIPGEPPGWRMRIADAYLVDKLDTRFEAAKRASAWLNDRIGELRNQLHDSEEAVTQFRTAHNLFQNGNITLSQQQLSELNAKLVEARADAAQKKARVDLLTSLQAKGSGLGNLPDFGPGSTLPALRQQASVAFPTGSRSYCAIRGAASARRKYSRAAARPRTLYRSRDPAIGCHLRNDYALAQSRVASLEKSLREATGQTSIDDATAIRLRELERTAAVNKTLFEDFLQRAKITQEQATFEPREVRVITPALPPGTPSYPRKTFYLSATLLIGLLLGVSGAVAKEMLNTSFTTTQQIEDILGLPVLASVSRLTNRDLTVDGAIIPVHDYPGRSSRCRASPSGSEPEKRHPYDRRRSSPKGHPIHLCRPARRQDHDRHGGGAVGRKIESKSPLHRC